MTVTNPSLVSPGLSLLDVLGHSMTVNGGTAARDYPRRTAHMLGAKRMNNRGWGGAISCWPTAGSTGDGGYPWALQELQRPGSPANGLKPAHPESFAAPYVPRAQLFLHHQSLNDLAELGSLNPRPMQEAHRTIWSRICAAAVAEVEPAGGTHATWAAPVGTWTDFTSTTSNSGAGFRYTSTIGDSITWNCPADYPGGLPIAFGFFLNAQQDLTIGVSVDGGAETQVRLQGSVLCDQAITAKHMNIVLRFGKGGAAASPFDFPTPLAAGAHTFKFTLRTQTVAGSLMAPDYAQIEADPADGPIIGVPLPNRPYDYSLWMPSWPHGPNAGSDPMSDASIPVWSAAVQALAADFPGRVVFIDIDTPLGKQLVNFSSDHAHPNNLGNGLVATATHDALAWSGLITSRVVSRSIPDTAAFFEPVGTAGRQAFTNSWTSYGTPYAPAGYHLALDGTMRVRGAVKGGSGPTFPVWTFNQGGRPEQARVFAAGGSGGVYAQVQVQASGVMSIVAGGNIGNPNWLDAVGFPVGQ